VKKEIKEVKEVKENRSRVAAFFDLDGTLVALPSMEQRFFRILLSRQEISPKNYFLWLREAARLARRGIQEMLQANKAYLRGVQKISECNKGDSEIFSSCERGCRSMGQELISSGRAPASLRREATFQRRDPRLPASAFFAQGVERVAWHAREGHAIVLLSGTLEPLAEDAARSLEDELAARGMALTIRVCATRLEEKDGRWTGNVLGEVMRGQAKARVARRLAADECWDLSECFAYGDSASDAWLLAAVGRPAAVNPSGELMRIARTQGWPVLRWNGNGDSTPRPQSSQRRISGGERAGPRGLEKERRREREERQIFDGVMTGAHDPRSLG
jgi:HAD superfamily phosphoserine phosphatase-like hydrolase